MINNYWIQWNEKLCLHAGISTFLKYVESNLFFLWEGNLKGICLDISGRTHLCDVTVVVNDTDKREESKNTSFRKPELFIFIFIILVQQY